MHLFLFVIRAADLFGASEHQLFKDYRAGFFQSGQKRYQMILSQVSYGLYPTGNIMIIVNKPEIRPELTSNLMVPYVYAA